VAHLAVTGKYYKEKKKVGAGRSLIRVEGFSCNLDISKLQFLTKKKIKKALNREILSQISCWLFKNICYIGYINYILRPFTYRRGEYSWGASGLVLEAGFLT
jgi:hypothetical protein